jgi:hypothetical protein
MTKLEKEIKISNFDLYDRLINNNKHGKTSQDQVRIYKNFELLLKNGAGIENETRGKIFI